MLFMASLFVFVPSARASADLYNISITPNGAYSNVKSPIVSGSISDAVQGLLILFDNIATITTLDSYSVSLSRGDSGFTTNNFSTTGVIFSPVGGTGVSLLPDGIYQISIQANQDIDQTIDAYTVNYYYHIDSSAPSLISAKTVSMNDNGKTNGVIITFSEPVLDSSINPTNFTLAGANNLKLSATGVVDDATVYLSFDEMPDSSFTGSLIYNQSTLTDLAGNLLPNSSVTVIDGVSARAPTFDNYSEIVKNSTLEIRGKSETQSTVRVNLNGIFYTVVTVEGNYIFKDLALNQNATNLIRLTAIDSAGNISAEASFSVISDTSVPAIAANLTPQASSTSAFLARRDNSLPNSVTTLNSKDSTNNQEKETIVPVGQNGEVKGVEVSANKLPLGLIIALIISGIMCVGIWAMVIIKKFKYLKKIN
jgi:hypothetical protein